MSEVEHINPPTMYKSPVFSQGVVIPANARLLLIGGQNGVNDKGEVVADDLAGQTRQALKNLVTVLEAAGGTLDDLVHVGLYIRGEIDIGPGFAEWMAIAGKIKTPPLVTGIRVLGLANPAVLIEIDAKAVLPG